MQLHFQNQLGQEWKRFFWYLPSWECSTLQVNRKHRCPWTHLILAGFSICGVNLPPVRRKIPREQEALSQCLVLNKSWISSGLRDCPCSPSLQCREGSWSRVCCSGLSAPSVPPAAPAFTPVRILSLLHPLNNFKGHKHQVENLPGGLSPSVLFFCFLPLQTS